MMQLALTVADPVIANWFTPEWVTAGDTIAVAAATALLILASSKHEKEAIQNKQS
jgi:hypothetical protein